MDEILVRKGKIGSIARKHSRRDFHVSTVLNTQQALMLISGVLLEAFVKIPKYKMPWLCGDIRVLRNRFLFY